tara:strand:+ start:141103 stop:142152 length:1050 start_codon:yes stop_codon:yes gene_type:complete
MKTLDFKWAIIGAGPAGIAAMGQLLDRGIAAKDIAWIDPDFKVGDFGQHWHAVSSNTVAELFTRFLLHCKSFQYETKQHDFALNRLPQNETCQLSLMAEPLQWVTDRLCERVTRVQDKVRKLSLNDRAWTISCDQHAAISAENVILATGAIPRTMSTPEHIETISMYQAMNRNLLADSVQSTDTVAIYGSSHSAIIVARDLLDIGVKKVINFYREPLKFAVKLDGFVLFDNTGLKGNTAKWAREHINGQLPDNFLRVYSDDANAKQYLPECTKAIHAIGFERRAPEIDGLVDWQYNPYNGIIAPGLFGAGIGFPSLKTDPYGNAEAQVGLWKFMDYLDNAMPVWLKYTT